MKTALITGASRGIGKETALRFAKEGYAIALCAHASGEALSSLQQHIMNSFHTDCMIFIGDVSDDNFVQEMVRQVLSKWGKIDVLVNNAGISHVGLLSDMTIDEWNHIISVNLTSVYSTCHAVIPSMVHEKSGRIINISSVWGDVGASCEVAYSACKGGINAFTKALAKELAPSGIAVNALAPGCVDTAMNDCFSDEEHGALAQEIPIGRFATAAETADYIYDMAQAPLYLTGQVIGFDGGWM